MAVTYHYCEQGTDEWRKLRLGIPTMSRASAIIATGRGGGESATRRRYLHELAAERITGQPTETFSNAHMERGKVLEPIVREHYAFVVDVVPALVGFAVDEELRAGCSPDALIGDDGMLEIKTTLPYLQVELLTLDRPPPEHHAQVQGGLLITGREWCDLAVYCDGLPIYIDRAHRDERFIKLLKNQIDRFNEDLDAAIDRVRRYGTPLTERLRESI